MSTSVALREQRQQVWLRMQEINDQAGDRGLTQEEQTNWDAAAAELAGYDQRIRRQELLEGTRATEGDSRGRPPFGPPTTPATNGSGQGSEEEYRAAFETYIRFGPQGLNPDQHRLMQTRFAQLGETRALGVASDTAGGYFAPDDFRRQVESAMLPFQGVRQAGATVIPTTGGTDLTIPTDNDTTNTGAILAENTQATELDLTIGARVLKAYTYTSRVVRVSFQLLNDSAFPIESWLAEKLGTRIGRITNTHFTTGQGPDVPSGIVPDSNSAVTAAATGAVTADELINLAFSVNSAYRERGRFMMATNTWRDLLKLKDGNGQYLWQPGLSAGAPDRLLGYPFTWNDDMPSLATGNRAVLFGDFSKYYIRDVQGVQLLRLTERWADFLQVGFIAFSRHDGLLIDAGTNPVRCITMA